MKKGPAVAEGRPVITLRNQLRSSWVNKVILLLLLQYWCEDSLPFIGLSEFSLNTNRESTCGRYLLHSPLVHVDGFVRLARQQVDLAEHHEGLVVFVYLQGRVQVFHSLTEKPTGSASESQFWCIYGERKLGLTFLKSLMKKWHNPRL